MTLEKQFWCAGFTSGYQVFHYCAGRVDLLLHRSERYATESTTTALNRILDLGMASACSATQGFRARTPLHMSKMCKLFNNLTDSIRRIIKVIVQKISCSGSSLSMRRAMPRGREIMNLKSSLHWLPSSSHMVRSWRATSVALHILAQDFFDAHRWPVCGVAALAYRLMRRHLRDQGLSRLHCHHLGRPARRCSGDFILVCIDGRL